MLSELFAEEQQAEEQAHAEPQQPALTAAAPEVQDATSGARSLPAPDLLRPFFRGLALPWSHSCRQCSGIACEASCDVQKRWRRQHLLQQSKRQSLLLLQRAAGSKPGTHCTPLLSVRAMGNSPTMSRATSPGFAMLTRVCIPAALIHPVATGVADAAAQLSNCCGPA